MHIKLKLSTLNALMKIVWRHCFSIDNIRKSIRIDFLSIVQNNMN